jgi:CO dehydrogenase nickel-insertion accessory protein CooC1
MGMVQGIHRRWMLRQQEFLKLQGKGGVGKSLLATLLAPYLSADKTAALLCADTDLVNDTFARYGAFGAQRIKILNADKNIDARAFDSLIEINSSQMTTS